MDDGAVRSLDLDIAFPEQLPVGSVLVVDLVEGYLVVDVPDVLESLGQFNVAIGEVEIQFRELAEPGLLHVALGPGLPGCGHGGFRLLPRRPDPLHLVGGEQFLGYGVVDVVHRMTPGMLRHMADTRRSARSTFCVSMHTQRGVAMNSSPKGVPIPVVNVESASSVV